VSGSEVTPAEAKRSWTLLVFMTIAFGFGFGVQSGLAPTFAVTALGLPREDLGLLEALREVPGLLTAAIIGIVAALGEVRLAGLALLFVAIGIGATGQSSDFWSLVACNVTWSIGLHVWLTVQPSLTLSLTEEGRHGHGLGLMNRSMAFAVMGGLLAVRLFGESAGYGWGFVAGGVAVAVGSAAAARLPGILGGGIRQRLVFRTRYWRYYLLMLLDGGRRQVVQTFAILILVKEFGVEVGAVAILLLVNNALTMAAAPVVGRWTDVFGERKVLSGYYALVCCCFLAYTQIGSLSALIGVPREWCFYGIFALDNLLFTASIGIQTYLRHTAPPEDMAPSMAMGLTWNHIAAVSVPLAAGLIWAHQGYQRIFLYGIVLAALSLAMCLTLPRKERKP